MSSMCSCWAARMSWAKHSMLDGFCSKRASCRRSPTQFGIHLNSKGAWPILFSPSKRMDWNGWSRSAVTAFMPGRRSGAWHGPDTQRLHSETPGRSHEEATTAGNFQLSLLESAGGERRTLGRWWDSSSMSSGYPITISDIRSSSACAKTKGRAMSFASTEIGPETESAFFSRVRDVRFEEP
jgi:hypothetical protein